MERKNNYGATPRRNALAELASQTEGTCSALTRAMNDTQHKFVFGETETHPTSNPETPSLPLETERRVQELSAQILAANKLEKITTDAITTTPCYIGEEDETCKKLIQTLKNQKGAFTSIIYLNGPSNKFSKEEYEKKLEQLKGYANGDKRIIIIGHLYSQNELQKVYYSKSNTWADKMKIGTIRADMIDAVSKSIDKTKATNPKIIGLDADTFKLDDEYITKMAKELEKVNGFLSGSRRRYDRETAKGDEWAFIIERMYAAGRLSEIWEWDGYGDGFLSGGTYGVKLSDYQKVGGFNRETDLCEDDELGKKLIQNGIKGIKFGKKVYSSPRRGQAAVNDGRDWMGQWSTDWKPVDVFTKEKASSDYKELTQISGKLLNGEDITNTEQQKWENEINKFYHYTVFNHDYQLDANTGEKIDKGTLKKDVENTSSFVRRRNTNSKGKYKIQVQGNGTFKLIKK